MTMTMSVSYLTQKEQNPEIINSELSRLLCHNFLCAAEICLHNKNKLQHFCMLDVQDIIHKQKDLFYRFSILSLNCLVPKTVNITDITHIKPHQIYVASIVSLQQPISQEELNFAFRAATKFCDSHANYKCSKCLNQP